MVVADAAAIGDITAPLALDAALLASVPIFQNLSPQELEQLAGASRRVVFQPGDVLVRKGELGEGVYIILEGRVEVLANEAVVSWLIAGDTVGDMSLFDGRPRSATCVALAPTTCLRLDRDAFLSAAQRNWSMTLRLFSVLAGRIRQADELLADHARDPLTGVNNRRALLDLYQREANRTQRAARQGSDHALNPLAVVFCDVDRFKSINDTYGHHVGDQVLIAVAQLLTQAGRTTDFVARYGGDEFVMLLPDAGQTGADAVMRRIKDLVETNRPGPVPFTISLGAAVVDPLNPPPYEEVIAAADAEMYRDKARTR
ncbi:MAG TPA: GGDEF domain-containing protein [Chloroflexota bacterium]|nr:GGDEF domain-containing protein [Chloroflexota bacterium]